MIELPMVPMQPPARLVAVTIDERRVEVPEGSTILDACASGSIPAQVVYITRPSAPLTQRSTPRGANT